MWCLNKLALRNRNVSKTVSAFYSRRSDSKNADSYKPISRRKRKTVDGVANTSTSLTQNWELLAPRGYRFCMPGSVGPAWHDIFSVHPVQSLSISPDEDSDSNKSSVHALYCVVEECPILLKKDIMELFPGKDFGGIDLTILTLSQKSSDLSSIGQDDEAEQERLAKMFVLGAMVICIKLRLAGYWADFINPFSGRPYLTPIPSNLYEADKLTIGDFHIDDDGKCRIINKELLQSRSFVARVFTTAPASASLLNDLL